MTEKGLTLACGLCDYTTMTPAEMIMHMVETGHGLSAEMRKDMMDGSAIANEHD